VTDHRSLPVVTTPSCPSCPPSCPRPSISITVSPILQHNATVEDLEAHIDIADWLIRYKTEPAGEPVKKHCVAFLKAARYISPEYHDELEALIEDLDLEFWGVKKVSKETSDEAPP